MVYLSDVDTVKFARTLHVPFSLGKTSDDKVHTSLDQFLGLEVIVSEKADGENTTHLRSKTHARSVDSKSHWSRDRMKALQQELSYLLSQPQFEEVHRICGENMVATHSIEYTQLPAWFLCFSIWNRCNERLDWDDMLMLCQELNITPVPELCRGIYTEKGILQSDGTIVPLTALYTGVSKLGGVQEGWVLTTVKGFHFDDYSKFVAKFVRANHVTSDTHWMYQVPQENKLGESHV